MCMFAGQLNKEEKIPAATVQDDSLIGTPFACFDRLAATNPMEPPALHGFARCGRSLSSLVQNEPDYLSRIVNMFFDT